jgi:hypothetical protein
MTHSLHRHGTVENLQEDYVVFAIAAQTVNAKGKAPVFGEFFKIANKYNPVFCGDMKTGNVLAVGLDAIAKGHQDNSIVHAVYTDQNTVAQVLNELREADLGLSIVVSGLLDHVDTCCGQAGIKRHTIEHSLGIHGNTKRLPSDQVLEISTMCGHGMVAFNLINHMVDEIKAGKKTPAQAADELAAQCHCGIVNPVRAAKLLSIMAG